MNEVIKENSVLNDDIKVKSNLIKLLRLSILDENGSEEEESTNNQEESANHDERIKCKECDYKTTVRIHMRSHMMVHTGQYQCQRGCKEYFKTTSILDKHHKEIHRAKPTVEFKCDE